MVRVISQGFTTPRSRHSSGEEMIDRFAAMKAVSALNDNEKQFFFKDSNRNIETKKLVIDCNTDTNDSFSCGDSEEDARSERGEEKALHGNPSCQDLVVVKKERRRERNKISAQSYRQRRRVQTSAVQKTLESLEAHHKILMEKVRHLEAEKHIVEEYLKNCVKIPWCPYHQPCKPGNCPPSPIPEVPSEPTSPDNSSRCAPDANANFPTNPHMAVPVNPVSHSLARGTDNMNDMSPCMSGGMSPCMSGVSTTQSNSLVS